MAHVNNILIIRRDLMTRMAELFQQGKLTQEIDRIPVEISKRIKGHERCCTYKARAVAKYKLMGIMGFSNTDDPDNLIPLSHFAEKALKKPNESFYLSVIEEACTSCVKANYVVTNLCKGCIARPCMNNCPKDAVVHDDQGKAHINPDKCISCGICQKVCPYHSIIYMPVPCEESCPVGAIRKNSNGVETIDADKCILCGKCVQACPFGSVIETSHLLQIMQLLVSSKHKVALVAPSVLGHFRAEMPQMAQALRQLGFDDVYEVAQGAELTAKHEAEEWIEKQKEGVPTLTTSCCPAWKEAARKHIPQMLPYVSHTPSPMAYTAKIAKEEHPNTTTVFIGPCIAKRKEGAENPDVDHVMTFEELGCLANGWHVTIEEAMNFPLNYVPDPFAVGFAKTGGVAAAVQNLNPGVKAHVINGLDKKGIKALKVWASTKKMPAPFIEVMSCSGGCLEGPGGNLLPHDARKVFETSMETQQVSI
jgi:[FeFe] hydrogenase (group B1/B3)